jgi:hypothetical protein
MTVTIFVGQPEYTATIASQPVAVKGELPAGLCMYARRRVADGGIDGQLPVAVVKMFPIRGERKFQALSPKRMRFLIGTTQCPTA